MEEKAPQTIAGQTVPDTLKNWMMATLTLIFIALYTAALLGIIKPLTDFTMLTRLEPIIFVIIGYYFGRLPAQQNEKTLKGEINRQTQKAEAAQHSKENLQQAREALEEKMRNAKIVLTTQKAASEGNLRGFEISDNTESLNQRVAAAVGILDS